MLKNRSIIFLTGFLFSIPLALTSYINSSFLEKYLTDYEVSILYTFASIVTILGLLIMPKILSRLGNRKTSLCFAISSLASLLMLAFIDNAYFVIAAFIIYFSSLNFLIATLDIFIEDFSKNASIGKLRGMYLTILNLAWVISQVVSGSIIAKSSFKGIYLFSALFMVLVSLIFIYSLKDFKDPIYKKVPFFKTIIYFKKNKNILKIYLTNFILKFFFVWMVIYTPLYLNRNMGFGWDKIGLIFTIMLLPFVILTYPLGQLSDKIGEKKMLLIGFAISAFATLLIPFINEPIFWVWAGILFATRVGAATIEIMSESYFFKMVNEEDADVISFFRNTNSLSYIIAPLVALPILFFVPSFEYIFFVLSTVLLTGLYITLRIKDVK